MPYVLWCMHFQRLKHIFCQQICHHSWKFQMFFCINKSYKNYYVYCITLNNLSRDPPPFHHKKKLHTRQNNVLWTHIYKITITQCISPIINIWYSNSLYIASYGHEKGCGSRIKLFNVIHYIVQKNLDHDHEIFCILTAGYILQYNRQYQNKYSQ